MKLYHKLYLEGDQAYQKEEWSLAIELFQRSLKLLLEVSDTCYLKQGAQCVMRMCVCVEISVKISVVFVQVTCVCGGMLNWLICLCLLCT